MAAGAGHHRRWYLGASFSQNRCDLAIRLALMVDAAAEFLLDGQKVLSISSPCCDGEESEQGEAQKISKVHRFTNAFIL
jgi:hypothetical protein